MKGDFDRKGVDNIETKFNIAECMAIGYMTQIFAEDMIKWNGKAIYYCSEGDVNFFELKRKLMELVTRG